MSEPQVHNEPSGDNSWATFWEGDQYKGFNSDDLRKFETKYYDKAVAGKQREKILFPMCGHDIHMKWYADQGHEVVGIEFVEKAVRLFFDNHNIEFDASDCEQMKGKLFQSKDGNIRIYCGDMYLFTPSLESSFDIVWDRGSFNTLDAGDREKYVKIMTADGLLSPDCRYFLETFVGTKEEGCHSTEDIKQAFNVGKQFLFENLEVDRFGNNNPENVKADPEKEEMTVQLNFLTPINA